MDGRTQRVAIIGALLMLALGCGPGAPAPAPASAKPAPPAAAPPGAAPPAAAAKPELATTPVVNLSVGTVGINAWAPFFIAEHLGYFTELGLNVDLVPLSQANEGLAPLSQGQLHVATCPTSAACYNALLRGAAVKLVAGVGGAGKTEKSTGSGALVVRKEAWDSGAIREARDLLGRPVYVQGGPGGAPNLLITRWLLRNEIDPARVDWTSMPSTDLFVAMQNGAADIGYSSEPLLSAGLARDVHTILAPAEELYPDYQISSLAYWTGIDGMGPMVGERFMVAYLRATRTYLNAFEYGIDQDQVIDVLTQETAIKDPAVYRQMKYSWIDPNGTMRRSVIESDSELWHEQGLLPAAVDLSQVFDDRYRQFALQYLGEYQPPR
ncbi:MAG TPA: ABC transporter substrate-binding protein [Chloroflexota bacterium]|nr:ABC transporter substrate-binding protein [Chloroflexota bacterium]